MPTRLNRALQVRTTDRLRASLARDETSGLPLVGGLSTEQQRELCEAGSGRLSAVLIRVEWATHAGPDSQASDEIHGLVMREVARRVERNVRRLDLLGSLREDALLLLAPALDPANAQNLADRVRALFADYHLEVADVQPEVRIRVGIASRFAASPAGWTTQTLADEAERNASELPPIAIGG